MYHTLLFLLCLLLPLAGNAQQIYKSTDADGNVVFSDTPPNGDAEVETVELKRLNTAPAPVPLPTARNQQNNDGADEDEAEADSGYRVTISSPTDETTIAMGPGNFEVKASVDPTPGRGHHLQLRMDGEVQGEPQDASQWRLTNVFRGAHDLRVEVVDSEGTLLAHSEPVRVYVLRPSINFRNRD
jgi:hypothetical protein